MSTPHLDDPRFLPFSFWHGLLVAALVSTGCRLVPVESERAEKSGSESSSSTTTGSNAGNNTRPEEGNKPTAQPQPGVSTDTKASKTASSSSSTGEKNTESGGESGPSNPDESTPKAKCKDGSNRECFRTPQGDIIEYPGNVPKGSCKPGKQTCKNGEWSPCKGAVAPKAMDTCEKGNDDNCNGIPMDHCQCSPGEKQECGSDVGLCKKGELTCQDDGRWGKECEGETKPSKEICDNEADENCDGKSDRENCECVVGDKNPCGKWSLGICKQGYYPCTKEGSWDTAECLGQILPRKEVCDGKGFDEDCDGTADLKDPDCECIDGRSQPCDVVGARGDCRLGKKICQNGRWSSCQPRFQRMAEKCGPRFANDHGFPKPTGDEDCDGQIDEADAGNGFQPEGSRQYMRDLDGDGYGAPANVAPL